MLSLLSVNMDPDEYLMPSLLSVYMDPDKNLMPGLLSVYQGSHGCLKTWKVIEFHNGKIQSWNVLKNFKGA